MRATRPCSVLAELTCSPTSVLRLKWSMAWTQWAAFSPYRSSMTLRHSSCLQGRQSSSARAQSQCCQVSLFAKQQPWRVVEVTHCTASSAELQA